VDTCVSESSCACARKVCRVGQNRIYTYTVYDRIFGDFPVKNAVYTPYICVYGSGHTYVYYKDRSVHAGHCFRVCAALEYLCLKSSSRVLEHFFA